MLMSNEHSDWGKYPMTVVQENKWPFTYEILDADGNRVHAEDSVSSSTSWKSVKDMLELKGIKDGDCGYSREEWLRDIMNQRKKLRFLAQTDTIEIKE